VPIKNTLSVCVGLSQADTIFEGDSRTVLEALDECDELDELDQLEEVPTVTVVKIVEESVVIHVWNAFENGGGHSIVPVKSWPKLSIKAWYARFRAA
jgi:hypothetical protein